MDEKNSNNTIAESKCEFPLILYVTYVVVDHFVFPKVACVSRNFVTCGFVVFLIVKVTLTLVPHKKTNGLPIHTKVDLSVTLFYLTMSSFPRNQYSGKQILLHIKLDL